MNGSDILFILDGESKGELALIQQYRMGSRGLGVATIDDIVCAVYESPGAVHSCSLDIIDISNPYCPRLLSSKSISTAMGTMRSVAPILPNTFVITTTRGFTAIDVSNPAEPAALTPYRTEKEEQNLTISLTSIDDWRGKKLDGVKFVTRDRYSGLDDVYCSLFTAPVEPWVDTQ